jgi:hypothetical protein
MRSLLGKGNFDDYMRFVLEKVTVRFLQHFDFPLPISTPAVLHTPYLSVNRDRYEMPQYQRTWPNPIPTVKKT